MRGSLRLRILLGVMLSTVTATVGSGYLFFLAYEATVRDVFDQQLHSRAREISRELMQSHSLLDPDSLKGKLEERSRSPILEGFFLQVSDAKGQVLGKSHGLGEMDLPSPASTGLSFESVHLKGLPGRVGVSVHMRVVSLPLPIDKGEGRLVIGTSMGSVDRSLALVRPRILLGVLAALFLAALTCWLATKDVSRLLRELGDLSKRLSMRSLDERLDLVTEDGEIGSLVESLNAMLERLQRGFNSQARFLADASHELKTPMTVLISEAQVLQMGDASEQEAREFALSVRDELQHLSALLDGLLMLARAERTWDQGDMEEQSLLEVCARSTQMLERHARSKGVVMNLECELGEGELPCVAGDFQLLTSLVNNLQRNAIEFTPEGERVQTCIRSRDGRLQVAVIDGGPGIPADEIGKIFESFVQVAMQGPRRGFGLGLSIAKSIAELHGARISVQNLPEKGCEFQICFGF